MEPDFSGYATKVGLKCTDGRTIMPDAFKHQDKVTVPLVWQHGHSKADNVLGHAVLENRKDGVYAYGYFNETPQGKNAKILVQHGDIKSLSIFANQLVERAKQVFHGFIREVSLVLAGANPGAYIENVALQHADGEIEEVPDEVIISSGLELEHAMKTYTVKSTSTTTESQDGNVVASRTSTSESTSRRDDGTGPATSDMAYSDIDEEDEDLAHAAADATVAEIYNGMSEDQKTVVHYMIGLALEQATSSSSSGGKSTSHSGIGDNETEGTTTVPKNVFEGAGNSTGPAGTGSPYTLTHDDVVGIVADAGRLGSLREAAHKFALSHGIDNIDVLFPDAKNLTDTPELIKRRTEWVNMVLNGTRHTPFSRVKSLNVDITQDEARAKGYIKGNYKVEEWVGATKRTTTPTTVYKKQKLDRDDALDITDFDVIAFLKGEMRVMLDEEVARAILIGDGRDVSNDDKVKDPMGASDGAGIRSILNDHELYVTTVTVNVDDANSTYDEVIDAVMDGMEFYKGTGTPTFFTTVPELNKFKQAKDTTGQRLYKTNADVAEALGVDRVVNCEPMKEIDGLVGIIVNLSDYNTGTDRGGEVNLFDDFDIDYNAMKYLMETRLSGALVRPKTAIVIKKTSASTDVMLSTPTAPTFVQSTGVATVPTMTNVTYKNAATDATLSAGAQTALTAGETLMISATADSGYYFANDANTYWTFTKR